MVSQKGEDKRSGSQGYKTKERRSKNSSVLFQNELNQNDAKKQEPKPFYVPRSRKMNEPMKKKVKKKTKTKTKTRHMHERCRFRSTALSSSFASIAS